MNAIIQEIKDLPVSSDEYIIGINKLLDNLENLDMEDLNILSELIKKKMEEEINEQNSHSRLW